MPDIKSTILETHSDNPQRRQMAQMALDAIDAAVVELAKLGHRVELVLADSPAPQEFPKMLYHSQFPGGLEVASKKMEEEFIGKGWTRQQNPTEGDFGLAAEAKPPVPELAEPPAPPVVVEPVIEGPAQAENLSPDNTTNPQPELT